MSFAAIYLLRLSTSKPVSVSRHLPFGFGAVAWGRGQYNARGVNLYSGRGHYGWLYLLMAEEVSPLSSLHG